MVVPQAVRSEPAAVGRVATVERAKLFEPVAAGQRVAQPLLDQPAALVPGWRASHLQQARMGLPEPKLHPSVSVAAPSADRRPVKRREEPVVAAARVWRSASCPRHLKYRSASRAIRLL